MKNVAGIDMELIIASLILSLSYFLGLWWLRSSIQLEVKPKSQDHGVLGQARNMFSPPVNTAKPKAEVLRATKQGLEDWKRNQSEYGQMVDKVAGKAWTSDQTKSPSSDGSKSIES